MNIGPLIGAAGLLSMERLCYIAIWREPRRFEAWCARFISPMWNDPVSALKRLFVGFKALQLAVFMAWCYVHGSGSLTPAAPLAGVVAGGFLLILGQLLNASVFYQLGSTGVFYGNRFGHPVRWCLGFPFSHLRHPQYVGTVLSIWGFFLIMRFPNPDWIALPILETVYYALGAWLENDEGQRAVPEVR